MSQGLGERASDAGGAKIKMAHLTPDRMRRRTPFAIRAITGVQPATNAWITAAVARPEKLVIKRDELFYKLCESSWSSRRWRRQRTSRKQQLLAMYVGYRQTQSTPCHRRAVPCVPSSQFWPLLGSVTKLTTCCWSCSWKSSRQQWKCGRWFQRQRRLCSSARR